MHEIIRMQMYRKTGNPTNSSEEKALPETSMLHLYIVFDSTFVKCGYENNKILLNIRTFAA